jgi:hypothetical protein
MTMHTEVIRLVETFLRHGQNPNADIRVKTSAGNIPIRFKALHVAGSALAQILLDYGADVNALNQEGYTPLDVVIRSDYIWEELGTAAEGFKHLLLLLNHGGCISRSNARNHALFLQNLFPTYPLDTIDPRIKAPPILSKFEVKERIAASPLKVGKILRMSQFFRRLHGQNSGST